MKTGLFLSAAAMAMAVAVTTALPMTAGGAQMSAAEAPLDKLIDRAIDSGPPFFTPRERAVIERACGYAPGSWNGRQINMIGNVFHCTNGRRVASSEVRAVMAAASPRIDAHIDKVMGRPDIVAAMKRVEREAEAEAMGER